GGSRRPPLAVGGDNDADTLPTPHPLLPRNRPNAPLPRPRRGPRSSPPTGPKTSSYSPTAPKKTARSQPGRRCPAGGVGSTRTESGHRAGKALKKRSSPHHTRRSETIKFSHRIDFLSTVFP